MLRRTRPSSAPAVSILDALADPPLFGAAFQGDSWRAWRAARAAIFGLPMGKKASSEIFAVSPMPGQLDLLWTPQFACRSPTMAPEPLAPVPVSIPHGFRHVGPSPEELLDRVLHNLLTARASKAERLRALDAELVLSAAEVERGGVVRLGVPVFRTCPRCGGTGGDWLYSCPTCDDRGVVETEAPVRVHIPPRVWDGTILELPLRGMGIHNLHVRLHLRIDPLL